MPVFLFQLGTCHLEFAKDLVVLVSGQHEISINSRESTMTTFGGHSFKRLRFVLHLYNCMMISQYFPFVSFIQYETNKVFF